MNVVNAQLAKSYTPSSPTLVAKAPKEEKKEGKSEITLPLPTTKNADAIIVKRLEYTLKRRAKNGQGSGQIIVSYTIKDGKFNYSVDTTGWKSQDKNELAKELKNLLKGNIQFKKSSEEIRGKKSLSFYTSKPGEYDAGSMNMFDPTTRL